MFRLCPYVLMFWVLAGSISQDAHSEEPHEVWLKAIEGTWTWNDDDRGKVTITFERQANGKCMVMTGKDDTGTFAGIVGWEPWSKTLTDTSFHSNGGGGRVVYDEITSTTLKGRITGVGPNGKPQPETYVHVVLDGNTITRKTVDQDGKQTTRVIKRVVEEQQ